MVKKKVAVEIKQLVTRLVLGSGGYEYVCEMRCRVGQSWLQQVKQEQDLLF